MKRNMAGNYVLGADLDASEVNLVLQLCLPQRNFTGSLTGSPNGKQYAIYNLTKPLFESLKGGSTISNIDFKDVNIVGTYRLSCTGSQCGKCANHWRFCSRESTVVDKLLLMCRSSQLMEPIRKLPIVPLLVPSCLTINTSKLITWVVWLPALRRRITPQSK